MKKKTTTLALFFVLFLFSSTQFVEAHRSGCHRWHSCPSDSGSYTCGDAGHPCQYPTYPASGGVIYPPSGFYRDCYNCPLKTIPTNDTRTWKAPLQTGEFGTNVASLQKALNKEGVYPEAIYSGYYGSLTEQAVKRFQKNITLLDMAIRLQLAMVELVGRQYLS